MNNKNIKELFEIFTPKVEEKDKMFYEILKKNKDENVEARGFKLIKRFKPAMITAVLIMLLTTTAFAAKHFGLDKMFIGFLNPSSNEQVEYLSNGAYVIDKQVSNRNGTLDIKQVIGDDNLTYILMDFIAREGTVLAKDRYRFEDLSLTMGPDFYSADFILLSDQNSKDNIISIVARIMTKNSIAGKNIKLEFSNLQGSDSFPGEFQTVIPGTWKSSLELNFKEYSTIYQLDKKISMFDYDGILKSVSVSPISISLKVESSSLEDIDKAAGGLKEVGLNEYLDNYPITINYKDGATETSTIFNGMYLSEYGLNEAIIIKTFENVINDKEIESIVFFDTIIPIYN